MVNAKGEPPAQGELSYRQQLIIAMLPAAMSAALSSSDRPDYKGLARGLVAAADEIIIATEYGVKEQ